MSRPPRSLSVFTHARPEQTDEALRKVIELARKAGVEVNVPQAEVDKHGIEPADGVRLGADPADDTDLAVVLGGDGTILSTLRLYAGRRVTIFAVNYGTIGFLATVDPSELEEGMRMALAGELDVLELPGLIASTADGDAARHERHLVPPHATPGGSRSWPTRWRGSSSARSAATASWWPRPRAPRDTTSPMAGRCSPGAWRGTWSRSSRRTRSPRAPSWSRPGDVLSVTNRSREEDVEMTTDGREVCVLPREQTISVRFQAGCALLAQAPGASFYHRLREKFGRLAY